MGEDKTPSARLLNAAEYADALDDGSLHFGQTLSEILREASAAIKAGEEDSYVFVELVLRLTLDARCGATTAKEAYATIAAHPFVTEWRARQRGPVGAKMRGQREAEIERAARAVWRVRQENLRNMGATEKTLLISFDDAMEDEARKQRLFSEIRAALSALNKAGLET